jgi:PAS domain S-box-containing protein
MSKTLDGTVTDWNQGAETLFGYTAADVVGKPIASVMSPELAEEELRMLGRIGRGEDVDNFETTWIRKDGAPIYVSVVFSPIRDGHGNIVGASKVARDITQRRQAEEILREKEYLLSQSQRIARIGSWMCDLADPERSLVWSDELFRMYGVEKGSFAPSIDSLIQMVLPDDRTAMRDWFVDCAAGKKPADLEFRVQMADGSIRYFSRRGELEADAENRPIRITGTTQDISERKDAENLLRESEERFQTLVNGIPQLTWMGDADGSISWYNQRWYEYTGAPFEETKGWKWQSVHHPDTLAEVMETWQRAIRNGELFELEFPLRGADGIYRTFLGRGLPVKDATGRVIRWLGTNTDISERKQNEERLAVQAEELARSRQELETQKLTLQSILDSMEEGLVAIDQQAKFILWNPAAKRICGLDSADMTPEAWSAHYGTFLPDMVTPFPNEQNPLILGLAGEVSSAVMYLKNRALDQGVWIEANGAPLRDLHGDSRGAVFAFRDITQRKADEQRAALQAEELARSRQELETQKLTLQSILDSLEEGLVATNEQGAFILWNPAAKKIIGLDSADMSPEAWSAHYGAFLPDMVTPFPKEQNPLVRGLSGEVSSAVMYLRNPALDRGVWIEANGAPLRDMQGTPRGAVIAFRDITKRKADELEIRKLNEDLEERIALRTAQLEVANKELEAFSYSVSHDLRAPLRHIAGFSRILIGEYGDGMAPEARNHLQRIQDAVCRMGVLVDTLLGFAKLGRQSLKVQRHELNAIVEEVVTLLLPECEGREVEWRVAELPVVKCDRILMGQVFQNLLGNALKYSRGRSKAIIEVDSIRQEGKAPVIFVRDNGAGFNMQYAAKLFEVFQRMHTESEFEGTGVGLATVHRIIQKHGGNVWAEAQMDQGATFFFTVGGSEQVRLAATAVAAGV